MIALGTFQVRDVPVGEYWIHVGDHPRKHVTVFANQTSHVQFP